MAAGTTAVRAAAGEVMPAQEQKPVERPKPAGNPVPAGKLATAMICRQIVREIGEMTNMRGSGIQALRQSNDEIVVEITLPKKIMNKMQVYGQV